MCVGVLPACLPIFDMTCLRRLEESVGSSGTVVIDGSERPCECWELNPGPVQEDLILLTSQPSLKPSTCVLVFCFGFFFF
jgi:hypothetical protein